MFPTGKGCFALLAAMLAVAISSSGCTSARDYFRNGLKVGPNYCRPPAPAAQHWIDAADHRVHSDTQDLSQWWAVFNDPVLDRLIADAYRQNLTLREAGFRVLQARALLGIAAGEMFPQTQNATGSYRRFGIGPGPGGGPGAFFDQWNMGFNLGWEIDFWGRFRRAVASADDQLDASVEGYDAVLVTLLGDVATNYVQIRTDQERIKLLRENVELQKKVLAVVQSKLDAGTAVDLDRDQALSNLRQTEAQIPQLEIDMRQASDRLCVLLGIPPIDLEKLLGDGPIPTSPPDVAVGIPADLLRRRPDVRQAERLAAAQAEQIGIAQADLYPAFFVNGTLGYQAQRFADLFSSNALNSNIGPSFQWNVLNYGRIVNNVRLQDARFQELVAAYQNTVLLAGQDVEDGLVTFLRSQQRAQLLNDSVVANRRAVFVIMAQYEFGRPGVDFNRYAVIDQTLIQQQDLWAQARGAIAQGLIQVYRALGGGWEIRLRPAASMPTLFGPQVPGVNPEPIAPPPPGAAGMPEALPDRPPEPPADLQDRP